MALPIATINIVLRTATVTRAGFGTPIFISSHRNFQERVRSYVSIDGVAEDFDSTDAAYIAAQQFFAHTPSVATLKIGRREASGTYTPVNVENGSVHTITITVNDGDAVTVSYTATTGNTAEEVATALAAAINGDVDVAAHITASVTGAGSAAVLDIALVAAGDVYSVSELNNITASYTTTEVAADVLDAIVEVDDDFYFITADDHTETFVLAMAAAVQSRANLYFTSSAQTEALGTYSVSSTDILAKLAQNNYTRTVGMYHQDADNKFVECNFCGVNAPYSPDQRSVVWYGRELPGLSISENALGNKLSTTAQLNLDARNASYIVSTNAGDRIIGGKTSGGRWADEMRTLDCMTARVREGQEQLLLNTAGTKVPGGRAGVALSEAALTKSLTPFIASDAITDFVVNSQNATIDQETRTLSGMEFVATLSGAIVKVVIDGALVNQEV